METKPRTRVTVQTVDGPLVFSLDRIKAHVDALPPSNYVMQDPTTGEEAEWGSFQYAATSLTVEFDGGVLNVCAMLEGTTNDGGTITGNLPVVSLSPSYWKAYANEGTEVSDFLAE